MKSAVEVAIESYGGDIEVAEDHFKVSAWLIALATAAIYFCFQELEKFQVVQTVPWAAASFWGYVCAVISFGVSFCAAYYFRKSYIRFRALSRNAIVAHKMLQEDLYARRDDVEKILAEQNVSLWALLYSGEIYRLLGLSQHQNVVNLDASIKAERERIDFRARVQRDATLFGFILLISLKLMLVVMSVSGRADG